MKDDDKLLSHEYDGIRELDNPLPRWWLYTFYITIVFSVGYVGFYHLGGGPNQELRFKEAYQEHLQTYVFSVVVKDPTEEELLALAGDNGKITSGKELFVKNCAACHGAEGQGGIGPNLTDAYWIHDQGRYADLYKMVKVGVPDKGMPPWGGVFGAQEMISVALYVHTLRGTSPPNPKAPQGNKVE